jgi:hypothetical protein
MTRETHRDIVLKLRPMDLANDILVGLNQLARDEVISLAA